MEQITLIVNNTPYVFTIGHGYGQITPDETLVNTLRSRLGLTGTKIGCDQGACGNCTVIMDGEPIASCMVLTVDCNQKHITTIEGLENPVTGALDPIQEAFVNHTAFQCGFCTPGIIMSAKALLSKNPHPSQTEIMEALSGNYCRCISHYQVLEAIQDVIGELNNGEVDAE